MMEQCKEKPAFYIRIYYSDSRLCGDTYHGICKALHAAELVHTLPAGYFDLSGLESVELHTKTNNAHA